MKRNITILVIAALVIALPFLFQRDTGVARWEPGDPVLVIISPHNEAIRFEFAHAFSEWHEEHYGQPVKIDWRTIGGTSEIMRYLQAEFLASFRSWWTARGRRLPAVGPEIILDRRFDPDRPPAGTEDNPNAETDWSLQRDAYLAFRRHDDPSDFTARIDLLFGGGAYDHGKAAAQGLTVPPWPPEEPPDGLIEDEQGRILLPVGLSGETWRTDTFFGAALSTFGLCFNRDRLEEIGAGHEPARWADLAAHAYRAQLGVADPTKSGSISKAFEMVIHEQCRRAVIDAGFTPEQIDRYEESIGAARLPPDRLPDGIPATYQEAVESGWRNGLHLVQKLGANARYFTDSAGKVPLDVAVGNAAAGLCIDFYGRFQAQISRSPAGEPRMDYLTPVGGSSVSADPISLLRGAEHRELAVRFIRFVLGPEGQRLWNYAPGTPGGPVKYALRRMPVRRDFYPSDDPELQARAEDHARYTVDDLLDPRVNPYHLAEQFDYQPRWTAGHFNVQRALIRAMCLDSGEELRAAWKRITENGGPDAQPEAMKLLRRLPDVPEPVTWRSVLSVGKRYSWLTIMREWTTFFRESYRAAASAVEANADRRHAPDEGKQS